MRRFIGNQFPRLTTALQYMKRDLSRAGFSISLSNELKLLLETLQTEGYVVIKDFITRAECEQWIREIENAFEVHKDHVQTRSDKRIFGIEKLIPSIERFSFDPMFEQIASAVNRQPSKTVFTMAGILDSKNKGSSGEGWHRDGFFSQFKSMLYLTDVTEENGPFEIIPRSHRLPNILRDMKRAKLKWMQDRLPDETVRMLYPNQSKALTGTAGSLVLFNSSAIHRGRPIQSGRRLALTNYIFENNRVDQQLYDQFSPVKVAN